MTVIFPVESARGPAHRFQETAVSTEYRFEILLEICFQEICDVMFRQPGIHRGKPETGRVLHPIMPGHFRPDLRPVQIDHMQFRIRGLFRAFAEQKMTDITIAVIQARTVHFPGHGPQFPDQGKSHAEKRRLDRPAERKPDGQL